MAYRNKAFVSFDGDNDMHYYRLMTAWKQSDYSTFNFYNAHDLQSSRDTSTEATIKRSLRARLLNSKVFVLLIGSRTKYLYRFVRWEIEQAIELKLPIIAVNVNGTRYLDALNCPPILKDKLAMHVSFNSKVIEYALDHWPDQDRLFRIRNEMGPYYYNESIYKQMGL